MKTFHRKCIKPWSITAENGDFFEVIAGETYLTSAEHSDGTVTVFTSFWVRVPVECFTGAVQFTGKD